MGPILLVSGYNDRLLYGPICHSLHILGSRLGWKSNGNKKGKKKVSALNWQITSLDFWTLGQQRILNLF